MRARGMSHNEDLRRVAPEILDVVAHPPHHTRGILHPGWKAHLGIQPIIRNDRDKTALSQRMAEQAIFALGTVLPAPSVEKDDDPGGLTIRAGPVNVEALPRVPAVGDVLRQIGPAAEQKKLRDIPWGAAGKSQEPQKREVGIPYLGRGSLRPLSGRSRRPSRMS